MESKILEYLLQNIPVVVFMGIALYVQRKDTIKLIRDYRKMIEKKEVIILEQETEVKGLAQDVIKISMYYQDLGEQNNIDHNNIKKDITEINNNVKDIKRKVL
jgi:hypothetical protein